MKNQNVNQHFAGIFNIDGEEINGELIYNKENRVIWLNLVKQLTDISVFEKSYFKLDVITGVLNSGTVVTLFHNRCTKDHTQALQFQQLIFVADYSIWSNSDVTNKKYNKLECILENALKWSGLSIIDTTNFSAIKFKSNKVISLLTQ